MSDVERYMAAGRRKNTVRTYESGLRHYEAEWKGLLPATVDNVCRYLAAYATELSVPTLKHRLAALSKWHKENRFSDPTKDSRVKQVLNGIKAEHPHTSQQAVAVGIADLAKAVHALEAAGQGVWGAMEPKTNVSSESHRKGAFRSPAHPPGITL